MTQNDPAADPAPAPDWIRARMVELERLNGSLRTQVRLLGVGFLACAAGVAALATGAWTTSGPAGVIEATAVVLRDDAGVARAELSIPEEGAAQLALRDRQEVDRLRMTVRGEGSPGVAFADGSGNRRIVMGLLPDETSTMVFADRGGTIRAVLGLSEDDRSNLVFADNQGVTRVGIGVDGRGTATLMLPEDEVEQGDEPGNPSASGGGS